MSICLDELLEQLQAIRQNLNDEGHDDVNPEVVISDAAYRTPKNYNILDEGAVSGFEAAMQAGVDVDDQQESSMINFVFLFGGTTEHHLLRYTPKAVLDYTI